MPGVSGLAPRFATRSCGPLRGAYLVAILIAAGTVPRAFAQRTEEIELLISIGRWNEAGAVAESESAKNPGNARLLFYLAEVYERRGRLAEAYARATRARDLSPGIAEFHYLCARLAGALCAHAENPWSSAKYFVASRRSIARAISLGPRNVDVLRFEMLFRIREPWLFGGSRQAAERLVREIAAVNPARGYLSAAELLGYETDGPPDSRPKEMMLRKSLALTPSDYATANALIGCLILERHYSEGRRTCARIGERGASARRGVRAAFADLRSRATVGGSRDDPAEGAERRSERPLAILRCYRSPSPAVCGLRPRREPDQSLFSP